MGQKIGPTKLIFKARIWPDGPAAARPARREALVGAAERLCPKPLKFKASGFVCVLTGWPAREIERDQIGEGLNTGRLIIDTGDVTVLAAACSQELFLALHGDFFECLETVGRKARTHYIQNFHSLAGEALDDFRGVGL